jgi:kinesin family protein 2/24
VFPATHAFGERATNADVFERTAAPLVAAACSGGVAALFMCGSSPLRGHRRSAAPMRRVHRRYGQTGSGKTFTMEAIELGAVGTIFALHKARRVSVNYFEIAGKRCVDLLAPGQREIVLKEELAADGKVAQAVALVGAAEVDADSAEALEACVRAGKARRATSATFCNASSSRSHAVLRLSIHVRPPPTLQLLEYGAAGTRIRQCVCARL